MTPPAKTLELAQAVEAEHKQVTARLLSEGKMGSPEIDAARVAITLRALQQVASQSRRLAIETCAKVADADTVIVVDHNLYSSDYLRGYETSALNIAHAIRALSTDETGEAVRD